jgi:hypothetical protein
MLGANIAEPQANTSLTNNIAFAASSEGGDPNDVEAGSSPIATILLGIDERGRPHASRFDAPDRDAATAAAAIMGFAMLPVSSTALAELAAGLPGGKIFSSGKAFVPFVSQPTFDKLVAYLPISARPLKPAASKTSKASSEGATGESRGGKQSTPEDALQANGYAAAKGGSAKPTTGMFPDGWDKIKVGHVVLASADRDEGWFTAHVREDRGDGIYVLEWEDFEGLDLFVRRREQLALLHPQYDGQ